MEKLFLAICQVGSYFKSISSMLNQCKNKSIMMYSQALTLLGRRGNSSLNYPCKEHISPYPLAQLYWPRSAHL